MELMHEENEQTVTTIEHVRYVKREQEDHSDDEKKVDFQVGAEVVEESSSEEWSEDDNPTADVFDIGAMAPNSHYETKRQEEAIDKKNKISNKF